MATSDSTSAIWTRRLNGVFLLVGVSVLAWMLYRVGLDELRAGLVELGWGFSLICLSHAGTIALDSVTLRACMGKDAHLVSYPYVLRASLAGHAINEATPLAKLGEVTKFSLLAERLPSERSAAALIVQNILMFEANCVLMVSAPTLAVLTLGVGQDLATLLYVGAGIFAVLGVATLLLMFLGPGEWPFRLARALGFKAERVDRWYQAWQKVEVCWREAARDRRRMYIAWTSAILSRMASITEIAIILAFLWDGGHIWPIATITLAGSQIVTWLASFIPLQTGAAEGGAYLLYKSLGLPVALGVVLELIRRLRRLLFIGVGVGLLGWQTFREMWQGRA